MRNSQKRKLDCEKSTKDMKDIGEPKSNKFDWFLEGWHDCKL